MWHFLPWCSDYHQSLIFPHKRKCGHVLSCQHEKNIRSGIEGLGDLCMFFYVITSEGKKEIQLEAGVVVLGGLWGGKSMRSGIIWWVCLLIQLRGFWVVRREDENTHCSHQREGNANGQDWPASEASQWKTHTSEKPPSLKRSRVLRGESVSLEARQNWVEILPLTL